MNEPPLRLTEATFFALQRAALTQHRLRTNDLVRLGDHRSVKINETLLLGLKNHDFTVLLMLARQAAKSPGGPIAAKDLVLAIEESQGWLGALGLSWASPDAEAVHNAVYRVRRTLRLSGLNPSLIESVPGQGYRLSAPAMNIEIAFSAGEDLASLGAKLRSVGYLSGEDLSAEKPPGNGHGW